MNNQDSDASWDFIENDRDPTPKNLEVDSHGTECAGVIAATGNNSFCGIGIAYRAKIGSEDIEISDGTIDDLK